MSAVKTTLVALMWYRWSIDWFAVECMSCCSRCNCAEAAGERKANPPHVDGCGRTIGQRDAACCQSQRRRPTALLYVTTRSMVDHTSV